MRAAVGALALLALLAGARADAAAAALCRACHGHCRLTIAATSPGKIRYIYKQYKSASYGSNVDIFCSSSEPHNLKIQNRGADLKTIQLNSTTIQLHIVKPNVGSHAYSCIDRDTNCEDVLIIIVDPLMQIVAPGVQHSKFFEHRQSFVALGRNYEVFCSGGAAEDLRLAYENSSLDGALPIRVEAVNETTIVYKTRADTAGKLKYYCGDNFHSNMWTQVIVNYFPETQEFRCINRNLRDRECSWISLNKNNNFKLFVKEDDGSTIFLCRDNSIQIYRNCKVNDNLYTRSSDFDGISDETFEKLKDLNLLMETCNKVFCSNQTFTLKVEDSLKLDPPSEFRMLNVSSSGVTVAWDDAYLLSEELRLEYRLEYQLLGGVWRQANTSAVHCEYFGDCEFDLKLPCPNEHYKVRLYVRLAAATEDRLWSEPAYLFFFTKRQKPGAVVSPECNEKFMPRKPLPSADDMLYKVEQLIHHVREKDLKLQTKIDTLRSKRKEIKVLMNLLELDNKK